MTVGALSAAVISALLTPAAGALARRMGAVAHLRPDRWHREPTPLLGGLAIAAAVTLPLSILADRDLAIVLFCAVAAVLLGLVDDLRHIAPPTKLVGQVVIASALYVGGVRVEIVPVQVIAFLLTVLWVVGIMNAINLLDNMDGLAAGISVIAAVVMVIATAERNPDAAMLAALTAGASLGFLVHNFPPARIFMGDAGSQLLGFLLAATALLHTVGAASDVGLVVIAPLFILAMPIFDVALVTVTRRLRGAPISQGGRDHTSHRLSALGLSERATVLMLYAITAALGILGLLAESLSPLVLPLMVLGLVGMVLFGVFLSQVELWPRRSERGRELDSLSGQLSTYGRFGLEVGLDVMLLTTAYFASYAMRFEGAPFAFWADPFVRSLPVIVASQLASLVGFGVYKTLWRHIALEDAALILRAITIGTAGGALLIIGVMQVSGVSRAAFALDWLVSAASVIGARVFAVWLRRWFAARPREGDRRVLVVGANDQGELALRLLSRSPQGGFRLVGFVDDDPGKRYRRLAGIPVLGTTEDLVDLVRDRDIDTVVLATDDPELAARVRSVSAEMGLECREFLVR